MVGACLEGESVVNHSYGSLCAEEEGSDAFGPGGDECGDEFEDGGLEVESESHEYFGDNFYDNWEERAVDGIIELGCINLKEITASEIMMCHFLDRSVAFLFHSLYAKMNGFAGFRDMGSVNNSLRRKLEPKAKTRCGCEAEMGVHLHLKSGRWIIGKKRRLIGGDAMSCLKFLESMVQENPGMYVHYLVDKDGCLVHLFGSNNCSKLDYHLFGDVVAFDVTYQKNKYMCRLVVFSEINYHNQTIVFATALVANENEQTYTWLLQ
ncbi:uncharacterized protein LOC130949972 [Arachis stenosperma]|uniref:uncharacterized protein LOC130949972 n=1 Tax=Arachis stenosperma TaxID=217475 RepID=UPI0025AC7CE7|nr:uncharacterized protein LOC130949972 [Arachis stenosperma]